MPSLQKFAEILLGILCGISPTIAKRKAKQGQPLIRIMLNPHLPCRRALKDEGANRLQESATFHRRGLLGSYKFMGVCGRRYGRFVAS